MTKLDLLTQTKNELLRRKQVKESFFTNHKAKESSVRTYGSSKPTTFYLKTDIEEEINDIVNNLPREKDISRSNVVEAALQLLFSELKKNNEEVRDLILKSRNA